jgi:hypothetical protein
VDHETAAKNAAELHGMLVEALEALDAYRDPVWQATVAAEIRKDLAEMSAQAATLVSADAKKDPPANREENRRVLRFGGPVRGGRSRRC